jgi:tubulin beta
VSCDENGIGGDGEYCGDNDAQLDRINVFYHEASGGKYVPSAVFFDLEPGAIDAARASPLGELSPFGKPRVLYARAKLSQRPLQKG